MVLDNRLFEYGPEDIQVTFIKEAVPMTWSY